MKRRLQQLIAALLTVGLALVLGACGDAANNNDNMTGTAVPGTSSGPADGEAPGTGTGGSNSP